jgi:pimeloyl-ACP methyl ester carboxylesterase
MDPIGLRSDREVEGAGLELRDRAAEYEVATINTVQDDAAMAAVSGTQTVASADGRRQTNAGAYVSVGARVITYDRPGYGGSDRFRGRRVVDSVADVSAIADSLGIGRFAVSGGSWGGPHSLAVAARLPERVTRAACLAGVAPFDMPGFDWFAGMDAVNIDELGWALEGEDVLAREIERTAAGMLKRVADDPSKVISDEVELSEADRAVMASTEHHEAIRNGINEAFRQGVWGYVDDILCLIQPWGFDVTEIRVPTRILYGLTDVLVPRQHGDWLADNVPNAEAVIDEQGGHMPDPNLVTERYGWLVQPV